jgi:hypothetical protein
MQNCNHFVLSHELCEQLHSHDELTSLLLFISMFLVYFPQGFVAHQGNTADSLAWGDKSMVYYGNAIKNPVNMLLIFHWTWLSSVSAKFSVVMIIFKDWMSCVSGDVSPSLA